VISKGLLLAGTLISLGFVLTRKKDAPPAVAPPMSPPPGPPPFLPGNEGPDIVSPLPNVSLVPCLDDNLTAAERQDAIALLVDFQLEASSGERETFAQLLDEEAAKAAQAGHPQLTFCLLAKAAAIRAGFSGAPTGLDPSGFPRWS